MSLSDRDRPTQVVALSELYRAYREYCDPRVDEQYQRFEIQFTTGVVRQRIRYEPRSNYDGWWRYTDVWTGCKWHVQERDPVTDLDVAVFTNTEDGDD